MQGTLKQFTAVDLDTSLSSGNILSCSKISILQSSMAQIMSCKTEVTNWLFSPLLDGKWPVIISKAFVLTPEVYLLFSLLRLHTHGSCIDTCVACENMTLFFYIACKQ